MKAAIYCRLSREDDDLRNGISRTATADEKRKTESESIQNQKSMLVKFAIEKGFDIYEIYSDDDYSGSDRDRPRFQAMLEAASQRKFDAVIVKTQSRFTRDMELVEKYLHGKFVEWGIRFIAMVDHADTADKGNKKARQINGLINEWYLEDLSENVRAVLDNKRQEGKYIASFPLYGYEKDPADKNHLVVDPEAAAVVKKIFALCLEGKGITRIAAQLNQEKIPSPTRYKHEHGYSYKISVKRPYGDLWGKPTIYQILRNRSYTGDLVQGRHKKISYKTKKTIWLPKEDWIVVPHTHEPIIDVETFEIVQTMLSKRARSTKGGTIHPLAQKVRCGCCGSAMEQTGSGTVRKDGTRAKYFRCRLRQRDAESCTNADYVPRDSLEKLVHDRIRQYVADYFDPSKVKLEEKESQELQRNKTLQMEIDRLNGEIARRRKAMQQLYLDKCSELVSTAQFREWNAAYLEEVSQYEQRIKCLEKERTDKMPSKSLKKERAEHIQSLMRAETLTRELVCLLIDHITVFPIDPKTGERNIEIAWLF